MRRYFEHLREVVNNILDLPNPNIEKVLTAMAHDSIEDVGTSLEGLIENYGYSMALSTQAVTKEPVENYMSPLNEDSDEHRNRAKEIRNEVYFSHIKNFDSMRKHIVSIIKKYNDNINIQDYRSNIHVQLLAEKKLINLTDEEIDVITQNALDVKFADRIHNLSTQWYPDNLEKTKEKIEETKLYFLAVAKETNKAAYKKIQHEILKLEMKLIEVNKRVDSQIKS